MRREHATPIVIVIALLGVCAAGGALLAAQGPTARRSLTSAEECGRCHSDIFRYWQTSLHARAADDARFQAVFTAVKQQAGGKSVDALCLRCHAPAVLEGQDAKWEKKVSWEGVTCDFCHSVRAVRSDAKAPFLLDVSAVKTGPLREARPTGHQALYSDAFLSSMLCNPCHQFTNANGLDVLSTYAEWQSSNYPSRGVTCQTCHMRHIAGKVVDPKVLRVADSSVNLHEMPGGHSVTELNRAVQAQIAAKRRGQSVDVTVQLTNRGAGHRFPTGSPLRSVTMIVEVDRGIGRPQTATRTYGRAIVDGHGQEVTDEAAVWLRGARTARDDRLAPNEQRVERFSFTVPPGTPVHATARFYYRYGPDAPKRIDTAAPFLSVSAVLPAGAK